MLQLRRFDMGTSGLASLRFPASLVAGLGITTTLFWGLWSFTDHTFEVMKAAPVTINFTRAKEDTPLATRDRVKKPERLPVDNVQMEQRPIGVGVVDVGPLAGWKSAPIVELPGPGVAVGGRDMDAAPAVRINPTYPPREAARGIEGWVLVQYDITATGAVSNVIAVDSEPGTAFDKAAVDAVARWRYNPSVVNGQAMERVGMQTMIRFTLEEAE
jgi:periplasmic protein TonB